MYAKELREKAARLAVDLQTIVDKAKAENNRGLTPEEREKFHALEADFSNLEQSISAAEKADNISAKMSASINQTGKLNKEVIEQIQDEHRLSDSAAKDRDTYAKAFSKMLRVHPHMQLSEALSIEERSALAQGYQRISNTMSTTTGSQGGYIVPTGFSDALEEAKKWFGGIDGVVGKFTTETGNPFPWPTINDTSNSGRILGQNSTVTHTDPAFNQVTFNSYIGTSDLVLVPLALMQDAYFDMDALVARLLGTRLGRLYNTKCTVGTGSSEPTGIVTAAVAAGSVLTLGTGNTTAISYANLVDLEHTVDPAYRYNPSTRWMFGDAVLKTLKKLVDGQSRPLWQPGLTASFRDGAAVDLMASRPTILDHPYIINQDMASPAANAYSILFGDMSAFKVREVSGGTTLLRLTERYADALQVGFIAFQRFDSQLVDAGTHPIAVLQQSAT